MFKFRQYFESMASKDTNAMLEELTEMANDTLCDKDEFAEMCQDCYLTEDELSSVVDGNIEDMSLYEYNLLYNYLNELNREHEKCREEVLGETDEEFLDKVNESLPEGEKIDKEEALEAKEYIDKAEIQDKVTQDYNEAAKQANCELFGTEEDLSSMFLGDLKYLIYKNHWQDEFDIDLIDNRQSVLGFLYHKLEDRIAEIIKEKNNINKEESKEVTKKIKEHNDLRDIMDFLENFQKLLK